MQQLQRFLLQLVQFDAILCAQRQLLRHVQLLGAVVEQRRDARLDLVTAIAAGQAHRLLLRPQHVGHPLGLQIAQCDGSQLIRRQPRQRFLRAVQSLPQHIAVYGGGQQVRAAALSQRLTHLRGGQLHSLRIGDDGHIRAEFPLQKCLLSGKNRLLTIFSATECADVGHGHHPLRFPPILQGQEHIRPHQEPQFVLRKLLLHHAQCFPRIAGSSAPQLHVQHLGFFSQLRRGKHRHIPPLSGRRRPCRQGLVGWDKRRDQQQPVQYQRLHGGFCRRDMPDMGRVKCPAVDADFQLSHPLSQVFLI